MMGSQRVQVFSLGLPGADTPKERRRYRVKWRIDGRDETRSFKVKAQAERFRSELHGAAVAGESFSHETGLPASGTPVPGATST